MTESGCYKIECPHCQTTETFLGGESNLWGVWRCPNCGGEFVPQPMALGVLTPCQELEVSLGEPPQ